MISKFWKWYEKNLTLNIGIATFLFTLQLVHLYWLSADVVATQLLSKSYLELTGLWKTMILIVDYTEIPALITTSLVYINEYRKKANFKSILFLLFLNSQWLHLFWITDEFVIENLTGTQTQATLPTWVAWIAIFIDYLELPVIVDTLRKFSGTLKKQGITHALKEIKE